MNNNFYGYYTELEHTGAFVQTHAHSLAHSQAAKINTRKIN